MDTEPRSSEALRDSRQADRLSQFSLGISALALLASGLSAWTANRSLDFNRKADFQTERTNIFTRFQSQYVSVAGQLPPRLLEPDFRPASGSNEYAHLQSYWLFCFSEWYATHRVDPDELHDLWSGYYVPLIGDGLAVPSLRYVLEDLIATDKLSRGDWNEFLAELARVARQTGQPLSPQAERHIAQTAAALRRE